MKLSINEILLTPASGTVGEAVNKSIQLAKHIELEGFTRMWIAEHHGNPMISSCAPEVLIPILANKTKILRIGSGGIMLNHYSPYKIAEMFCLLNDVFSDRIDLGIGRSSSGQLVDLALRRDRNYSAHEDSEEQLIELLSWLDTDFPSENSFKDISLIKQFKPACWLLGSSLWSSSMAGTNGLPYVFADFFQPNLTKDALNNYYNKYKISKNRDNSEPYSIISSRIVCADSEEELRWLSAPLFLMRERIQKGMILPFETPENAVEILGGLPKYEVEFSFGQNSPIVTIATPSRLREILEDKTRGCHVNEIMFQDFITDHDARLRCYSSLSGVYGV